MEDNTMDRAEPRESPEGAPAVADGPTADPHDPTPVRYVPPALPVPEQPDRLRGRHEAPRRTIVGFPAGVAIGVVVLSVVLAGMLATRLISSAESASDQPPASATSGETSGAPEQPTSRPPGAGAYGNLVVNWSFEQDLSGWEVLGTADSSREPQGRTSGSAAAVRARGPQPGRIGLALPQVVPAAKKGERYVASAWVRSTAPGQTVVIRLVGTGGESSRATTTTLPGLAWRRVIVDHTVRGAASLRLEIAADGVPAGDTLLVDEVVVRRA